MFKKNLKLLRELAKCMLMAKLYLQILVIQARSHMTDSCHKDVHIQGKERKVLSTLFTDT